MGEEQKPKRAASFNQLTHRPMPSDPCELPQTMFQATAAPNRQLALLR